MECYRRKQLKDVKYMFDLCVPWTKYREFDKNKGEEEVALFVL
jgi:hypothetical protein